VDEYIAEFLRLIWFAPYMVAEEEDRANRFQQGLRRDIQMYLVTQPSGTYSLVLGVARGLEKVMEKENMSRLQIRPLKRPFDQVTRGPSAKASPAPSSRHPFSPSSPSIICGFFQRSGHSRGNCRWANDQCLACGSRGHHLVNCPSKGQRSIMSAPPISEATGRNPVPAGRGAPLPSQRQVFE